MPRLFFAIWPDTEAGERLETLASELNTQAGGRAVPRDKVHLTLAFLGEVAPDRADDLVKAADAVRESPFELVLDRIGAFRRARVAWVGTDTPPEPLLRVEAKLREGLRARGFDLEERPFKPHVTLVRKVDRTLKTAEIAPVVWPVREIALVRSDMGKGSYTTMATWELKARKKAKG